MNVRGHMDTRRYNPARDIAYAYANMVRAAFDGLEEDRVDYWMARYLKSVNVGEEGIAAAAVCLAKYFNIAMNDQTVKTPSDALRLSGFLDLHSMAQHAVMVRIGQVATGMFFSGIREVYMEGDAPPVNDAELLAQATAFRKSVTDWYGWRRVVQRWRNTLASLGRVLRFRKKTG